jgi:hypothetical protein
MNLTTYKKEVYKLTILNNSHVIQGLISLTIEEARCRTVLLVRFYKSLRIMLLDSVEFGKSKIKSLLSNPLKRLFFGQNTEGPLIEFNLS